MINPRHLKAFLAVARVGSITGAADDIHRAQSAVTRSIKELEKALGAPLFERRPRGMLLTESGRVLLSRARNAVCEMDAARTALGDLAGAAQWNATAQVFTLGMGRRRLQVVTELMKQQHMGAVADMFAVTQPAVSQVLRDLEQGIGLSLVTRNPTGVTPNSMGRLLAVHLRRALAEINKAEEEIASLLHGVSGHVTVGTLSLGRNKSLARAIIRMARDHPNITVTTVEGTFEHLASLVRAADIDFMIGGLREPEHMVGLSSIAVAEDQIALIMRPGHPLATILPGDKQVLNNAGWVLPIRETWTRTGLETALKTLNLAPPKVVVETTDISITRDLVLESDLITAASPNLFHHDLVSGHLFMPPFVLPSPPRNVGIIQRLGATPSPASMTLIREITQLGYSGPNMG